MIIFKKLQYKNFRSVGNAGIEINFQKSDKFLFIGKNGSGKTTGTLALSYVLFGKVKDINLPKLVNTINGKDCLVTLWLEANNKEYKIIRGQTPKIFEIYENGELIPIPSDLKDYQKIIENKILKMDLKTFLQIITLGSATYTPFMKLSKGDRKQVVESILDIGIFSTMNVLVKLDIKENERKIKAIEDNIRILENKLDYIIKQEKILEEDNKSQIESKQKELDDCLQEQSNIIGKIQENQSVIDSLEKELFSLPKLEEKRKSLYTLQVKINTNRETMEVKKQFFDSNQECPTCTQQIDPLFKDKVFQEIEPKIQSFVDGISQLKDKLSLLDSEIENLNKIQKQCRTIIQENISLNSKNNSLQTYRNSLERDISRLLQPKKVVGLGENSREKVEEQINSETLQKDILLDESLYLGTLLSLLKDDAIKASIISKYIPLINAQVNYYLQEMDFFVSFNLDEEFNETIKSRHRDEFSYDDFSQGEKMRIDLALLFTWRDIAKIKSSTSTNLLVLDEIGDGPLDDAGVEDLMKILNNLTQNKQNVIVISHKDLWKDKFPYVLEFEKVNNFSVYKERE